MQLTQRADRLMEMHGISKSSLSAFSTPSTTPASSFSQLEIGLTKLAGDIAYLQKQTVSPSSRSQPKPSTPQLQSAYSPRLNTAATRWYHTTFGIKARRYITPCSFTSRQSKRVKRVNPKAVNTSPITPFGTCSLSLDIGLRRLFLWVCVGADISCAIFGSDFLTAFNLLVNCHQSPLHDKTTNLTIWGISSSDASRQLAILDPERENPFRQLLAKYHGLTHPNFSASFSPHDVVHHVRTTGLSYFFRSRRLAPARRPVVEAEFEHTLQASIIRQSESPWASPLHMVPKAATGDWHPCGDYRILNKVTASDCYPVPHLQYFAGALFGKSVFSKSDLVRAFHQIPIAPEDVSKAAVTTLFGFFEFLRSPFGLRNASQTFQSSITDEHMEHLAKTFDRLQQFGVVSNPSERVFGVPLEFLGHLVDSHGMHPHPPKVTAIREFPPPSFKRQLQRFLGMVNFYSRSLPHFADTILSLTSLLSDPIGSFELSADDFAAFDKMKAAPADATLLTHFSPYVLISPMVDASSIGVGAVLLQNLADHIQPSAFFSRKLSPAKTRYSTFERERLAVFLAVEHFRHLLEGRNFTVLTDHKSLSFALKSTPDNLHSWQIRQLDYFLQFTSEIRHIYGSPNGVADALSRPSIARLQFSPGIDLAEGVAKKLRDDSPCDEDVFGLQLQDLPLTTGNGSILCDNSTTSCLPFVPPSLRRKVFSSLNNLSYPGSRATDKLVSDRLLWRGMHKDLKAWTRACLGRQGDKVQRHKKAPIGTFPTPDASPETWEKPAQNRLACRRETKTGVAIYEANRIAVAKAKRIADHKLFASSVPVIPHFQHVRAANAHFLHESVTLDTFGSNTPPTRHRLPLPLFSPLPQNLRRRPPTSPPSHRRCLAASTIRPVPAASTTNITSSCNPPPMDRIPDTDVLERRGILSIYTMLRQRQLRWSGHLVRMDNERLPKRLFYGDVATGSRRQEGQIRCHKDILKSSLKCLQINPTNWEKLALDRPAWRRTVKTDAAIYEANRIAAAKVIREARKSQLRPVRNAAAQPLPTRPRCQRTFWARIGLVGHLRINWASRTAPTIVPPLASSSPPPPTNSDNSSEPPL
nr:unnamed protein product [Spirometra erinaceieuropaei]